MLDDVLLPLLDEPQRAKSYMYLIVKVPHCSRVQFHTHVNNHKSLNKVNSIDCILFYHYIAGNVWYMITCTSLCNFKKVDFCLCSLHRGTFSTNPTVSAKMYKKDSASKQAADSVHGNNEWKETRMLAKMYRLNAGVRNDNFHLE